MTVRDNLGSDDGRAQVDLRLQVPAVNTFGGFGAAEKGEYEGRANEVHSCLFAIICKS